MDKYIVSSQVDSCSSASSELINLHSLCLLYALFVAVGHRLAETRQLIDKSLV